MATKATLPPLAYCALKYLLMWLQEERALHAAFAHKPSDQEFRQALRYFRISRNFKGITEGERLRRARSLYLAVASKSALAPENQVVALATAFKREFNTFNVSAASKLLWLKYRAPFVVLDTRAVSGLKRVTGERFTSNNYIAYSQVWRCLYEAMRDEIGRATSLLPEAVAFLPASHPPKSHLSKLCSSQWFSERVLDIFLWEAGDDG